jgi:hypothetical protein
VAAEVVLIDHVRSGVEVKGLLQRVHTTFRKLYLARRRL